MYLRRVLQLDFMLLLAQSLVVAVTSMLAFLSGIELINIVTIECSMMSQRVQQTYHVDQVILDLFFASSLQS